MKIPEILSEHYSDLKQRFPCSQMVVTWCRGSQVYGLDTPDSDVDTMTLVTPTLDDIVVNKKAVSTTYYRDNKEQMTCRDIRLVLSNPNLNFIEGLFSPHIIVNPKYLNQWSKLLKQREKIARYNPHKVIKALAGYANSYFDGVHEIPDYNPKQLCGLLRTKQHIENYINGK